MPPFRIAVVVVHGIANQVQDETARSVADLLLRNHGSTSSNYSPFEEAEVRIKTEAVNVPPEPNAPEPSTRFDERSKFVRSLHDGPRQHAIGGGKKDENKNAFGFMQSQLREFKPIGSDGIYAAKRLKSTRHDRDVEPEVHIYEMYWADLSRLRSGFLRVFGELFQLFFHLGSLGRQTADFVWATHVNDPSGIWWHGFQFSISWAVRLLSLPIALLNLFLLAIVFMPLPGHLLGNASAVVSWSFMGVAATIGSVILLLHFKKVAWLAWLTVPPLSAAAGFIVGYLLTQSDGPFGLPLGVYRLLALESCAILGVLSAIVIRSYSLRRPGAGSVARWLGLALIIVGIPQLLVAENSDAEIFRVALSVTEIVFVGLLISWILLLVCIWLAIFFGLIAISKTGRDDKIELSRAMRAAGTACIAISLPCTLFLFVTLILYRALSQAGSYIFQLLPSYHPSWILTDYFGFKLELPASDFLDNLIVTSATPLFLATIIALAAAVVMVIWALFPAVLSDFSPSSANTFRRSAALGNWLSNGYRLLVVAAFTIFLICPVFLTAGFAIQIFNGWTSLMPADETTPHLLVYLGGMIVGSISGLLVFHGRLEKLALGLRPALDTILDVDNYMREHPRGANPRARICCRYASLLRFICNWKDLRDNGQYQGIIIVAHSQGTVISAELLRFLKKYPDPSLRRLDDLPVYLFTVGCPLRQLYGWRFPHLYAWARGSEEADKLSAKINDLKSPDPRMLGVKLWVNAFRSGDYVGRNLWRNDDFECQWGVPGNAQGVSEDSTALRREFCIGAGGHTHYFDDTAPEIAVELDRLIAKMAKSSIDTERPIPGLFGIEELEPDESTLIREVVEVSQRLLDGNARPVKRGQHPKQHACVSAKFEVRDDLGNLAIGLFRAARTYQACIRFSNGHEMNDAHPDIHGMAIKVFGVEGEKLLKDEIAAPTQDFLLIDHPTFFIGTLRDYVPFSRMLLSLQGNESWAKLRILWFFLSRGQWKELGILRACRGKHLDNPLATTYWSTTPYRFGPIAAVKYRVVPIDGSLSSEAGLSGSEHLREAIVKALRVHKDIAFKFEVQLQTSAISDPIEDPTVEWTGEWMWVATIRLAGLLNDCACENMAFTPWHALPDHRPLGAINRARKEVYLALAKERQQLNGIPHQEPAIEDLETSEPAG